jgi:hypothetical protein
VWCVGNTTTSRAVPGCSPKCQNTAPARDINKKGRLQTHRTAHELLRAPVGQLAGKTQPLCVLRPPLPPLLLPLLRPPLPPLLLLCLQLLLPRVL